jgi:hypothetical protein
VMIPAYWMFGNNPLYYNLSAFVFRVAGGLALWWILNLLWPRQRIATTGMALLFLIYPGFLSQPNAIDYQSHIVGLAAALCSIALTLKAVSSGDHVHTTLWHLLSFPFGWLYLSQMEWYIGIEFFRWACVFLYVSRQSGTILQKGLQTIRRAYPALVIPLFFLVWRLFFFVSDRGATDVDFQFERFKLYPLQTLFHWSVQVVQDLFDVMLSAWSIPLSQLTGFIQPWGAILSVVVIGMLVFILFKSEANNAHENAEGFTMTYEALMLGLLTAVAGLIPIAMVNREVLFPPFSRYSLVSSVGVAIFIVALLSAIKVRSLRISLFGVFVLIAMLTHHANSMKFARETSVVRNFWWQVSWRVPQVEQRTTLVGNYPLAAIEEDYFIWGPASLIYYPANETKEGIQPGLFATLLNRDTVVRVLSRERQQFDNRKNIVTYPNYRNILILTQPASNSCVHVIDGLQPAFSQSELDSIRVIGPYSEMERVLVDETPHAPPTIVFGAEPDHGWCYYYQKADLARQRGDWEAVLTFGEEAFQKGLVPGDSIEWMPFLQAYAYTNDAERLAELAVDVAASPYIARQACLIVGDMPDLSESVIEVIDGLYCLE